MADLCPESFLFLSDDDLLLQIITNQQQAKHIKELGESLRDELCRRYDNGDIDNSFTFADWNFSYSEGRRTYDYPESVKNQEANLKAARRAAEADGTATPKIGAPFWTVKPPAGHD